VDEICLCNNLVVPLLKERSKTGGKGVVVKNIYQKELDNKID
jgi:methyl coenzyme M reductase beta subunit